MAQSWKLLIVDDDPSYRQLVQGFVEKLGHGCIFAEDGEQAIEVYRNERPDAILMDIRMPMMDGIDAAAAILSEDFHAQIAFVSVLEDFPAGTPGEITCGFDIHEKPKSVEEVNAIISTFKPNPVSSAPKS